MYVCLCKGVTDAQIKQAMESGADSFREIRETLGVATVCGSCACATRELINAQARSAEFDSSLYYQLA